MILDIMSPNIMILGIMIPDIVMLDTEIPDTMRRAEPIKNPNMMFTE